MSNKHLFRGSESISHCDYHEDKNTLEIGFTSGSVYHYPDCPKHEYDALKQAASAGKHFHKHIRKYRSVKLP